MGIFSSRLAVLARAQRGSIQKPCYVNTRILTSVNRGYLEPTQFGGAWLAAAGSRPPSESWGESEVSLMIRVLIMGSFWPATASHPCREHCKGGEIYL